jgi:hypothetical protein
MLGWTAGAYAGPIKAAVAKPKPRPAIMVEHKQHQVLKNSASTLSGKGDNKTVNKKKYY